jgi:hypothetical protein
MKRMIWSVFCLMAVFVGTRVVSSVISTPEELVIKYTKFEGHDVSLVIDYKAQKLLLRLDDDTVSTAGLDFLVREAKRLTAKQNEVITLTQGIKVKFLGGHLIWAPYGSHGPGYKYKCFVFAQGARVNNGVIEAKGTETPPIWDGYVWWAERTRKINW